jgi:hypothetical protein
VEEASINPLALLFLVAMCLVVLCASRHIAVCAVLVTAAFIPLGQQFVFAGLHLYFLRILILAGVCRLLTRHEARGYKLETVDKLFVAWAMTGMICGILRGPSAETFGAVYDSLGVYFLIRILTRDATDILAHLKTLVVVSVAMAFCMAWETLSHHNVFHVLGGVPEIASERYERFRAQGPFRHAILAGTFGATLFPLMIGLWFNGGRFKRLAIAGAVSSLVITVSSASSGPLMSLLTSVLGMGLWSMRMRMHVVRRSILFLFIALALLMNAPVWYLIGRVSELTGGTGWYRSFLIEQAIKHFGEWWLIGSSHTAHWSPWQSNILAFDRGQMDITNHYIVQGLNGGVLMLSLFLAIIVNELRIVGRTVRARVELPIHERLVWGFGVALVSHCMAFISVSYFDQIRVFWFWLLAVIPALPLVAGSLSNPVPSNEPGPSVLGAPDQLAMP